MISIIVAVSEDWGIGKDNELLWHISEDLKRFKRLTTGNTVIMGKRGCRFPGNRFPEEKILS
jgi:dihydrofolate reductase